MKANVTNVSKPVFISDGGYVMKPYVTNVSKPVFIGGDYGSEANITSVLTPVLNGWVPHVRSHAVTTKSEQYKNNMERSTLF